MMAKGKGMSTMSRRVAGPLVAVLLVAGAVSGAEAAQAIGAASGASGWHDGACAAHEGQTVVVDHSSDMSQKPTIPDNWKAKAGVLVRCNIGGAWADPNGDSRMEPLTAVGIEFAVDKASVLVNEVNGIHDVSSKQSYWIYSSASISHKNWNSAVALAPGKDTWVGVTLGGRETPSIDPPVKK